MNETKKCTKCGETKPLSEFYTYTKKNKKNNTKKTYYRGACKSCINNDNTKYWQEHRERLIEYSRKYYMEHPECRLKWNSRHKDYCKEYNKKWLKTKNGIEYAMRGRYKRRSILKDRINDLTAEQWEEIKKSQNYTCLYCGKQEPEIKLTRDHIIPVSKGGHHTASNIQGLCRSCNSKKGARDTYP